MDVPSLASLLLEIITSKRAEYGLDMDAVNWASIKVCEVCGGIDGPFVIFVSEASPNARIAAVLEEMLAAHGVDARVVTEW